MHMLHSKQLQSVKKGLFGSLSYEQCVERYINSINNGLLKVMSKMGISVINSYRGGCNFEAIGLSRTLMSKYFPSMSSKISGVGLAGIEKRSLEAHTKAFDEQVATLPVEVFIDTDLVASNMHLRQSPFICCNLQSEIKLFVI